MQSDGLDILNLGIGNPDLLPPTTALESLSHGTLRREVHGYQPYKGIPELRSAISTWYQKIYGVSLGRDQNILPLIGSKEGIFHISMAFLNPGDQVLIPNPGYPTYSSVTKLIGGEPIPYLLDEANAWQPNLEEIAARNLERVKIMWLNTPHMPTGVEYSSETILGLITLSRKHRFLIINDNPYSFILNDAPKSILEYPGAREVAIELNSLSKSHHMAGWRMGWVAGNEDYINTILKVKSNMDSGMFRPIQEAAIAALSTDQDWHNQQNEVYQSRKVIVEELLRSLRCTFSKDQKGMFVWAKIPDSAKNAKAFSDQLLYKNHLFIPPGTVFGSQGERYIRISLCVPERKLKVALDRTQNFTIA